MEFYIYIYRTQLNGRKSMGFTGVKTPYFTWVIWPPHGHLVELYGKNQTWQARKTGQWRWWFPISHPCFSVICVFLTPDVYGFDRFSYQKLKTGGFTPSLTWSPLHVFPWNWVIPTLLWRDTTTMSEHLGGYRCARVDQLPILGKLIQPFYRESL